MDPKSCNINSKEFLKLIDGLEISPFMKLKTSQDVIAPKELTLGDLPISLGDLNVSDTLYCSYCNSGFVDRLRQREHYKLDWHRYNLKLFLAQRKPVSEEKFSQMAGDVSSISGSDSESETDEGGSDSCRDKEDGKLSHLIARKSRILFNNSSGNVISLNRCLLLNKKEEAESDDYLVDLVKKLSQKTTWLIVMLGGGHFAAAIFKDGEPIVHKTFHSYTVRAKQGGSQSGKDGKGTHSKSAGASMRRYNEQSLSQHVQDTLKGWGPEINKCDFMFYRAVGRGNYSVLFSGANAPLVKADPRVRAIPISSRRPTFNEVKRVYQLLSTVFIYDSQDMFRTQFSPQKPKDVTNAIESEVQIPKVSSPRRIDRAKERPVRDRKLPEVVQNLADVVSSDESQSVELNGAFQEINFHELKEYEIDFGDNGTSGEKKSKQKKKKKEKKPQEKSFIETLRPEVQNVWMSLHSSIEAADAEDLQTVFDNARQTISNEELGMILNEKNIEGHTILHKLSSESKGDLVRMLLLNGCDPCIKDKKSLTPYDHCPDKGTRLIFRRFMGDFPEMYDYSKSHIPGALTEELENEIAEKKKAVRKAKRLKDKEKKQAVEAVKQEEEEKKRFLALSDREKRALAAEKRIIAAQGPLSTKTSLSRCFLCGADMTGKVPFEYDNNRFCTMDCLKKHRVTLKTAAL